MKRACKLDKQAEQILVEQTRGGSPEAFADLVRMYSPLVYQVSLNILQNCADAEDNVQNTFWKAYESIGRFEGRSRFSTRLVRIAINEALMRIRAHGPEYLILDALKPENKESALLGIRRGRADPERQYLAKELTAKAFLGFPASLVDTFIRKAEGWTQRELAGEMGITLSALKSRMFQARERMHEHLDALR
jgi:RNA polymerase sigma-70 factor (ECF subfamily)